MRFNALALGILMLVAVSAMPARATSFTVNNGQTLSDQELLANETGTINLGGTLQTIQSANGVNINMNGSAVFINGANASLVNNGTIRGTSDISGDDVYSTAYGVNVGADDAHITNYGTILTTAQAINVNNGVATVRSVLINGNNIVFTNNGTITATDLGATGTNATTSVAAITINGNNARLVLGANSQINGAVQFLSTGGVVEYTLGGPTYPTEGGGFALHNGMASAPDLSNFSGTYTVNEMTAAGFTPEGAVIVTAGNGQTLAVTPDVYAGADSVVINQTVMQAGNLVVQRQQASILNLANRPPSDDAPSFAFLDTGSIEPAAGHSGRQFWAEGFGSYRERPANGDAAFSRARAGGVLAGIVMQEDTHGITYGIYGGGFRGENQMGETTFRTIDSNGVLAGLYAGHAFGHYYFMAQLAGGYAAQESERLVGTGLAQANYHSFFAAPSVSVMRPFRTNPIKSVLFVPSITARYTAQYTTNYTESGSTANQSVRSRDYYTVGGRVQIEAIVDAWRFGRGNFIPSLRLGVDGEADIGGHDVDLNVLGTDVSFDPQGGSDTLDSIIGVNLSYVVDNGPQLYLDGEASIGLNKGDIQDNKGGTARVGARWHF